jgi:hypothetical protein
MSHYDDHPFAASVKLMHDLIDRSFMTDDYTFPAILKTPFGVFCHVLFEEVVKATSKHQRPIASPHEGFSIILEELEEFKSLVFGQDRGGDVLEEMFKELTQVCAMAFRTIFDCLPDDLLTRDLTPIGEDTWTVKALQEWAEFASPDNLVPPSWNAWTTEEKLAFIRSISVER